MKIGPAQAAEYDWNSSWWARLLPPLVFGHSIPRLITWLWQRRFIARYKRYTDWHNKQPKPKEEG